MNLVVRASVVYPCRSHRNGHTWISCGWSSFFNGRANDLVYATRNDIEHLPGGILRRE